MQYAAGRESEYGRGSQYGGRGSKYGPSSPYPADSSYDAESQFAPPTPPPIPKSPRHSGGPSLPKTPVGWVGGHV